MQNAHCELKEIIWEITDNCNQGCSYCGSKDIINKTPNIFQKIRWKFKEFFHKEKFENSRYYTHAIREFKALGYIPPNEDQEDGPNKWIQENVLELLEVVSKQGHSGFSIGYVVSYFSKLAKFEPLSPILCTDDEWNEVTDNTYQNNRLSSVFKEKDGKPYYLDAIVWRDQTGSCFTGTVEGITSKQTIKLPFVPKTFYVDVESYEVCKETGVREIGSGWWESKIVNKSQLIPVFEYYERKD